MTLGPEDKKALSDIRFQKAVGFLEDARANLEEKRLRTAINRSYYAALNAVRALLVLEGIDPESHSGAITAFSLRFVKPGLVPPELTKSFKVLQSRRADADYGDFETPDAAEAGDSLAKAETLLKSIDAVRKKLIADLPL